MSHQDDIGGLERLAQKQIETNIEFVKKMVEVEETYSLPQKSFQVLKVATTEDMHLYESAGSLIKHVRNRVNEWSSQCPPDVQPVILAILNNGLSINVYSLYEEGHNGIMITGILADSDMECMLLSHQANLQLFCFMKKLRENEKKVTIGFRIHDEIEGTEQE